MIEVRIRAKLYPTESPEKVKKAILNLFPDAQLIVQENCICGEANSLDRFAEIIRDNKIRDSARAQILNKKQGGIGKFHLNKQAAFVGKVNFVDEAPPLGAIEVELNAHDLRTVVDEVAPSRHEREGGRP